MHSISMCNKDFRSLNRVGIENMSLHELSESSGVARDHEAS